MPPPQRLLSPNTERLSRRCAERPWGLGFSSGTLHFLHVVILCLLLLPLSAPSKTGGNSSSWGNSSSSSSSSWSHWEIPEDEVCPSARAWVTRPGSFCTTLWTSPYLSNRTELESRERRAVQIYCELDVILERFDCGQEYSVNVKRGQCQLCRQAYREWVCAVVADTTADGSLDCATKLMPCPSCASICHQVMRLCPYLSPDRMQFDLLGQSSPQVSQYGGHPAFYCPLENDDPSDPAYTTSLCLAPQEDDDPDHVHNICTNPPLGLSLGGRIHTHQFLNHHLHHHAAKRTRRDQTYATDDDYTTPRPNHHPPPYDYGGGGGSGYDDYDDASSSSSSSPIPMHYTTCCWTYASSLVIFDATKDYPNYGSDAFFSTTLTIFDNSTTTRNSSNLTSTTSSPLLFPPTKKTAAVTPSSNRKTSTTTSTTPLPTTTTTKKYANSSSEEDQVDTTENRVILNCCNSHGECNAVDGDDEGENDAALLSSSPSPPDDDVFLAQEIKSDVKFSVKNRKRSSEREREISDNQDVGSGVVLLEGDLSSSSSTSSSSSPPVLSLPSLFFKTIDTLPPNPTHIVEQDDDDDGVEYDEHYMDTEPDQQQGGGEGGSTSTERLVLHNSGVVLDDEPEEDLEDLEEEEEEDSDVDEEEVEVVNQVEDLFVKKKVVVVKSGKKVIKKARSESVHLFSNKKDAFMSIVIGSGGRIGGDEHVLDRDHHPQPEPVTPTLVKKRIIPRLRFLNHPPKKKTRHNNDDDESFTFVDNTLSSRQDNRVHQQEEKVVPKSSSSSSPLPPRRRSPSWLELLTYFIFLSSSSLLSPVDLLIFVFTVATSVVAVVQVILSLLNLVATTSTTTSPTSTSSLVSVLLISAVLVWISARFHFLSELWRSTISWCSGGGSSVKLKKYCVHRFHGAALPIPEKIEYFLLLHFLFFSGRRRKKGNKLSPPETTKRSNFFGITNKTLGNNKYYYDSSASVQSSLLLSPSSSRRKGYYYLLLNKSYYRGDVNYYSRKINRLLQKKNRTGGGKYQCCYYCHDHGHGQEWGCDLSRRRWRDTDDNNCITSRKKRRRKQNLEKIFTIFVIDCCQNSCPRKELGEGFNFKFLKVRADFKLLNLKLLLIHARLLLMLIVFKFMTLSYRSEISGGGESRGKVVTHAPAAATWPCSTWRWRWRQDAAAAWVKLLRRRITSRPCSVFIVVKIHEQNVARRRKTTPKFQLLLFTRNTWRHAATCPSITITTTLSDDYNANYYDNLIPSKKSRDKKFLVQFHEQLVVVEARLFIIVKKKRVRKCCQNVKLAASWLLSSSFQKLWLICYYTYYRPKSSFSKKIGLKSGLLSLSLWDKKRLFFLSFFELRGQSDTLLVGLGVIGHKPFKGHDARAPLKLLWKIEKNGESQSESRPINELLSSSRRTSRESFLLWVIVIPQKIRTKISIVLIVLIVLNKKWCSPPCCTPLKNLTRKNAAAGFEIHPLIKL